MNKHATTYRTRAGHTVTADQTNQEHAGHRTATPDAVQNGAAQ